MRTFDTNVLVRILIQDEEAQCHLAVKAWQEALADGGAYFPKIVLVETTWVLRRSYKLSRAAIALALQQLLDTRGVVIEEEGRVRRALSQFETGGGDLADYLIFQDAKAVNALPVMTFDQKFSRTEEVELLTASE